MQSGAQADRAGLGLEIVHLSEPEGGEYHHRLPLRRQPCHLLNHNGIHTHGQMESVLFRGADGDHADSAGGLYRLRKFLTFQILPQHGNALLFCNRWYL